MQKVEGEGKLKLPEALLSAMMLRAEKERILAQQQAVDNPQSDESDAKKEVAPKQTSTENATKPTDTAAASSTSTPSVDEQAQVATKNRITNLINAGAIVLKDTYYVIDVKLAAGQISVNGRPLSAEMLQF